MKKNQILLQYTFVSLLVIIIASIAIGFFIGHIESDHIIKMHVNTYPGIIYRYMEENPGTRSFFRESQGTTPGITEAMSLLSNMMSHGDSFSLRLWDNKNRVTWDGTGIMIQPVITKEYSKARQGIVTYKLIKPSSRFTSERYADTWILDIFVPVIENHNVIGVVEIYERAFDLQSVIKSSTCRYWGVISISGLFLYLSLFYFFYRANKHQSEMLKRLEQTQDVTIFALAHQAELRDNETKKHLERTASYVKLLAEEISRNEKYRDYLTDQYISDLVKSTPLHDIGKIGIPDSILMKPGPLTENEFNVMKKHSEYGMEVLKKASSRLSFQSFLDIAIQLTGNHHEKWDGSGYPKGISGESIPISGRIMALADVYDALRSSRPYKKPFPHETCVKIISEGSGIHFDPEIVEAFLSHEKEFLEISESNGD